MSGFDDNPFGEPIDNPFADPAIQQATRPTETRNTLDDYNPFDQQNNQANNRPNVNQTTNSQPAIMQPTIPAPAYNQSAQTYQSNSSSMNASAQISTAELQRRQEELDRKAQELDRREQELRSNTAGIRRNNWPPLPEKCCFQPCFYQDINVDIPSEFQRVVRHLYYVWMFYALVMTVNIFGGLLILFHTSEFRTFGLAILYAFLFTPASFLCWYRPAYKAFRSDSSFNFMVFFFVFFFQMCVTIIQTVGIPGTGTCGFIMAIKQFDGTGGGIFVGLLLIIIAMGYGLCAAADIMLITKIHAIYRSSDASLVKAQAEFASEFMRNQHVQRAAQNAASAAVSSQFSGSNNRY